MAAMVASMSRRVAPWLSMSWRVVRQVSGAQRARGARRDGGRLRCVVLWQAMVRVRLRRVKAWDRASVNLGRSPGRRSAYLVEVSFDGDAVLPMVQGGGSFW